MIGDWYYDNVSETWRLPLLFVALFVLIATAGTLGGMICWPVGSAIGQLVGIAIFGGLFYPINKE